jgi:translation initiation factor IF-3
VHPPSPHALGKEVNSDGNKAGKGFLLLRGCCVHSRFLFWIGGALAISKVTHQLNEEIRDKEIRLISDTGEQLGIVSAEEALRIAEERGLDLVKISAQAVPPVCKLMNYGKYRFEQSKREKEARKNQHVVEIKEIRMSPGIDVGDFNTKLKNAQKFLNDGDRVKVSIRFRGREMAHTEIGADLLKDFAEKCAVIANMDKAPKLEGRNMSMFLSPKPVVPPKKPAKPKQPKPAPEEKPAEAEPAGAETAEAE